MQKRNSLRRNHPMPNYSLNELKHFIDSTGEFDRLYNQWVDSNFDKMKIPSIDRKRNSEPYSLDNISLMTWEENWNRARIDIKNGNINIGHRPVLKLSKDGIVLEEYVSAAEAARHNKAKASHITAVCNNKPKRKTAGGFKWKHK